MFKYVLLRMNLPHERPNIDWVVYSDGYMLILNPIDIQWWPIKVLSFVLQRVPIITLFLYCICPQHIVARPPYDSGTP